MNTFETIAGIVERVTGVPASSVTPATTFIDVAADSFDHIEIVVEVERDCDVDLDQDDLDLVRNMGELAELVDKTVAAQKARAAA